MSPQVHRVCTLFWTLSRPHVPTLKAFLPSFPFSPLSRISRPTESFSVAWSWGRQSCREFARIRDCKIWLGCQAPPGTVFVKCTGGPTRVAKLGGSGPLQEDMNKHTGCPNWAETWVGLTLISVFHHLSQLPSRVCQIPISPRRVGRQWNTWNPSQQKPVSAHLGHPVHTSNGKESGKLVSYWNDKKIIFQLWCSLPHTLPGKKGGVGSRWNLAVSTFASIPAAFSSCLTNPIFAGESQQSWARARRKSIIC